MGIGTVFVVSAPSGAGKTSLLQAVLTKMPSLSLAVSYTTRARRPAEIDNASYRFVSQEQFADLASNGAFLESAEVFGNYYATSREWVMDRLHAGKDVVLELDWQGALQVQAALPDAVLIFIVPPAVDSLSMRLQQRAQDDQTVIATRFAAAKADIAKASHFDYVVVNADFSVAVEDLCSVMRCYQLTQRRQQATWSALLADS